MPGPPTVVRRFLDHRSVVVRRIRVSIQRDLEVFHLLRNGVEDVFLFRPGDDKGIGQVFQSVAQACPPVVGHGFGLFLTDLSLSHAICRRRALRCIPPSITSIQTVGNSYQPHVVDSGEGYQDRPASGILGLKSQGQPEEGR